jgi:hypothetical protein
MVLESWGELMPYVNAFTPFLMNGLSNSRRSRRSQKQRDVIFLLTKRGAKRPCDDIRGEGLCSSR